MTSSTADRSGSGALRRWWTSRWALGAALAVLAVVFIIENRQPTEVRVLVPVLTMPLWAALTGTHRVGVRIGV